jgi:hypothetical protein
MTVPQNRSRYLEFLDQRIAIQNKRVDTLPVRALSLVTSELSRYRLPSETISTNHELLLRIPIWD